MSRAKVTQTPRDRWGSSGDFKACVHFWASKIDVRPARVQMQRMSRKWASCSPRGVVTFSTDLLHEPREVGEAVIVHELIHLKVPNHGAVFKSLMRAYLPNYNIDLVTCKRGAAG